jgi:hypothetical protein
MPYWNDSEEKERGDEEKGIHFCSSVRYVQLMMANISVSVL